MAHVLLIDDDPDLIAEQVRQAFPPPRHRVEVAGTGADGLSRVRADPPDVILLDLRLPDQSGLDVYRQVRLADARIPVLFVTLAKSSDAAIEAMKQGAYDYLFKPLDLHQLKRVVGEALEVARRMREPAVLAELGESAPDPDVEGAIIGTALYEEMRFDASGQPQASTFADYLLPGACNMPTVRIDHMETVSPYTEFGVKGIGEGGAIAPPAAIANAINDALRPLGGELLVSPITPYRVVEAIARGNAGR